ERVMKQLPGCKHVVEMACNNDPSKFRCTRSCNTRLEKCGHLCRLTCHVSEDPHHLKYLCKQNCARKNASCSENHPCTKKCYEPCGLCMFRVEKKLPKCGHKAMMYCSDHPSRLVCQKKCEKLLNCGHKCKNTCFQKCGGCNVLVMKTLPGCKHK
ncbi:hypothetical protein L9F63_009140, partial [Diploptera punctata]